MPLSFEVVLSPLNGVVNNMNAQFRPVVLALTVALFATACSDSTTNPNDDLKGAVGFRLVKQSGPDDVTPDGSIALIEDRSDFSIWLLNTATGVMTKATQLHR